MQICMVSMCGKTEVLCRADNSIPGNFEQILFGRREVRILDFLRSSGTYLAACDKFTHWHVHTPFAHPGGSRETLIILGINSLNLGANSSFIIAHTLYFPGFYIGHSEKAIQDDSSTKSARPDGLSIFRFSSSSKSKTHGVRVSRPEWVEKCLFWALASRPTSQRRALSAEQGSAFNVQLACDANLSILGFCAVAGWTEIPS